MSEFTLREARGHGLSTAFITGVVLVVAAILWSAPRAARGDYRDLLTAFVVLQAAWIVLFWRMGVYLLMAYVVVEGFFINYFSGVPELNLVKDVFVLLLYLTLAVILVMRHHAPFPRLGWVIPFALFALVYVAEVFNPSLPNILVGLVGVRVTLYYFVLAAVGYWFFDSVGRVVRFFAFMVLLSIPVAAFGIVQYFKGPAWMVSLSPGFARAVFYAAEADPSGLPVSFRTFSTFVQTGSFAHYLALMLLVTAAFWALFRAYWQRMVLVGILVLQFFALLTTGGRTPMVILLACVALWVVFQKGSVRLVPAILLLPLCFYVVTLVLGTGFVNRFATLLDLDFVRQRNSGLMVGWLEEAMKTDWAGLGAGYAAVASRHVGETALNGGPVENTLAKIRYEAGWPGLLLYIGFLVSFGVSCARQAVRVPDPRVRWFATPIAAVIMANLLLIPIGVPFEVSPTNVYLWFFAGFLGRATTLIAPAEPIPVPARAA